MKFTQKVENLIANFRNVPENSTRATIRKPRAMEGLVGHLIKKFRVDQPRIEEIIMHHWAEIVGATNCHRCRPKRITQNKKLIVAVASPVIRQEMIFAHKRILQKLQKIPDCKDIQTIVFVVE